jgi:hypothetical protein
VFGAEVPVRFIQSVEQGFAGHNINFRHDDSLPRSAVKDGGNVRISEHSLQAITRSGTIPQLFQRRVQGEWTLTVETNVHTLPCPIREHPHKHRVGVESLTGVL